jgi:glycosyltransferase involved in cell wall biosynthesis
LKYGGNTACVEVQVGGHLIILDAGTGLISLGNELMQKYIESGTTITDRTPVRCSILLSHIHLDHIQGFPFFRPSHLSSTRMALLGGVSYNESLEEELSKLLFTKSFPLDLGDIAADLKIMDLNETNYVIFKKDEDLPRVVRVNDLQEGDFNEDDVVFIFLGRLNHDKGIGELYEAFDKFVVENPKAKLLLYGTDEEGYEEKAKNYPNIIRDKNFFYPGLTRTPFEALQAGDVFVLPTWREGFGSSVIEAQALALPVITSDAYGVVDASVPGETGMRCKVNDPEGLRQCMKYYYDNPEIRKQHGINGRKRVEEKFDNNVVTQAWVEFYRKMLS